MQRYTRDGAFFKDTEGNLTTSSGLRVLGYGITGGGQYTQDVSDIVVGTSLVNMVIPELIDVGGNEHKLEAFSIDSAGLISAVYDNGELYYLGRLAIAKFNNTGALQKLGGNAYTSTTNSGPAQTGGAAEEGFGIIRQGNLEMSNVDLANEFTEMIVTSRAYQANARIITTSDEMLQELVNLKR